MPSKTNISAKPAAKICDGSIKYAKLKGDGAIAADNVRSTQQAPVSESSQNNAHPHRADDGRLVSWLLVSGCLIQTVRSRERRRATSPNHLIHTGYPAVNET